MAGSLPGSLCATVTVTVPPARLSVKLVTYYFGTSRLQLIFKLTLIRGLSLSVTVRVTVTGSNNPLAGGLRVGSLRHV